MHAFLKIDIKVASGVMIALLSCAAVFHLIVLAGVVPYSIVWGGRLESATQMYIFETISLTVNLAVIIIVGIKGGFIKPYLPNKAVTFSLWVLAALFALNTVGNLFAESKLEMILFTPLTLLSSILFYRMAIEH